MTATPKAALDVEIRDVQPQPYLGKHLRAPLEGVGASVRDGFAALYHALAAEGAQASAPPFLVAQRPQDGYLEMEVGAPCVSAPHAPEGFEAGVLPGGRVAVVVHRGSYEGIGEVYTRLEEWISAHGFAIAGPPREVYLTPPGVEPVTEIAWPIR